MYLFGLKISLFCKVSIPSGKPSVSLLTTFPDQINLEDQSNPNILSSLILAFVGHDVPS
jgi:hypothetical protein